MPTFLGFTLQAPMASWGEVAVGEVRGTQGHPTRSALLGLMGAALGVDRVDFDRRQSLADSVGFAVRTDRPGTPVEDYHTTQVPPSRRGDLYRSRRESLAASNLNTILSSRQYLLDGEWTVVAWQRAQTWDLANIADALRKPTWTLCLGRKSCPPAAPLEPRCVDSDTVASAFAGYDAWHRDRWPDVHERRSQQVRRVHWEPGGPPHGFVERGVHERRDEPIIASGWNFSRRSEAFGEYAQEATDA